MPIRTVKPTSPARRYLTYVTYDEITKTTPEKSLLLPKRRTNGRNVYGRITVRHRGGGAKRMLRQVKLDCMATIGQVGNLDHENVSIGKAGRVRWRGFRPTVRGTVMNPVDHPMGGGEGKGKGNHPMTPWGKPTKGYKTRRGARPSDSMIVTRRKK